MEKKRKYSLLPKETFRGHTWYRYINEFIFCGSVELPSELKDLAIAVLDRIGYEIHTIMTDHDKVRLYGSHTRPYYFPDNAVYAAMNISQRILLDLGSIEFVRISGCYNFLAMDNALRMNLPKNKSNACLLTISLIECDVYSMDFGIYRRLSTLHPEGTLSIQHYDGVFSSNLCRILFEFTGISIPCFISTQQYKPVLLGELK